MLAPLLDRMVARDPVLRFTAAEALAFLEDFHMRYTADDNRNILQQRPRELEQLLEARPKEPADRWSGLSDDFIRRWSRFREPPLPWRVRILMAACNYDFVENLVRAARRMFDILFFRTPVITDVDFEW